MDLVTIDFEASCLPRHGRSFPIEVGIATAEVVRSWLIRPLAPWRLWDWTDEAIALHGILPGEIEGRGEDPASIFAELMTYVRDRRIVADSSLDAHWWRLLADAAGYRHPPRIEHIATIFDEWGVTSAEILAAQADADVRSTRRHRAADDALWLWDVLISLEQHAPVGRWMVPPSAMPASFGSYALC